MFCFAYLLLAVTLKHFLFFVVLSEVHFVMTDFNGNPNVLFLICYKISLYLHSRSALARKQMTNTAKI